MSGEAGCRDRFVTIEQVTDSKGNSGFPVETGTALGSKVWMQVLQMSGAERFSADQVSARAEVHWVMPYQVNMDPDLVDVPKARRLVYQGRNHDIVSAKPMGYHDKIELWTLAQTGS